MKSFFFISVVLVLVLNLFLKIHNYDQYPQRGATSDEYTYSFMGMSLLTTGVPISWSYFYPYTYKFNLTINKIYFPMVYPYFDHPPLNGLLVGGFALLRGENTFEKITLSTIRIVPIIFSMLSALFLMVIAKKLYDSKIAIWAGLIYTCSTLFTISGRMVVAENLLTLLFLIILYLFIRWKQKITLGKSLIFGILCGLCFWTKEAGIVMTVVVTYYFLHERIKLKNLATFLISSILFVLGYVAYGFYFDKDIFLEVLKIQSTRIIGPETLREILFKPEVINKEYFSGWYYVGFIAAFLAMFEIKKHVYTAIPLLFYFLFLLISVSFDDVQGWYLIPFFPFLALFSAYYIRKSIENKNWFLLVAVLFIGLHQIEYFYKPSFGLTGLQYRIMLILLFAPFMASFVFKKFSLYKKLGSVWFYGAIFLNAYITYSYIHPA